MSIVILGIDLGKNSCSIVGLDADGAVIVRRRMRRHGVVAFAAKLPSCTMAMEACCGAHHMGRSLAALGHEIRLMSPEYVRPYVKAQKNDDRDAEAIAEAATRPTMRFVELKSEEQLDVQTLHRVRDRLVGERTSLTNQIRSLLLERGYVVAQGHARLRLLLGDLLDTGADALSPRMAFLLGDMRTRWAELDRRIAAFDAEFSAMARLDGRFPRLVDKLARVQLLVLDDWGTHGLTDQQRLDLLELFEERYQRRSTIITAQLPVSGWHDMIGEPTIADAILDRIVHNAHRIELKGDSMRRKDRNANLTSAENTEIIRTET